MQDLDKVVKKLDFDLKVTVTTNRKMMIDVVEEMNANAKNGDLIVFYYTGHSYQINDFDYLIPIDDDRCSQFSRYFRCLIEQLKIIRSYIYIGLSENISYW